MDSSWLVRSQYYSGLLDLKKSWTSFELQFTRCYVTILFLCQLFLHKYLLFNENLSWWIKKEQIELDLHIYLKSEWEAVREK